MSVATPRRGRIQIGQKSRTISGNSTFPAARKSPGSGTAAHSMWPTVRLLASPKTKNARMGKERTIFEATPLRLGRKFENDLAATLAAAPHAQRLSSLRSMDKFSPLSFSADRVSPFRTGVETLPFAEPGVALSYHLLIQMPRKRRSLKISNRLGFSAAANSSLRKSPALIPERGN